MSDPVTNVEIEDVLSSIRRLVSEEGRDKPRKSRAVRDPGESRLVLTPALRVADRAEEAPEPVRDRTGDAAKPFELRPEFSDSAAADEIEFRHARPAPEAGAQDKEPVIAPAALEPDAPAMPDAGEFEGEAQMDADADETPAPFVLQGPVEVESEAPGETEAADAAAPWADPEATLHEAAALAESEAEETAAETVPAEASDADTPPKGERLRRAAMLSAKIQALEAAIAETPDQWEPDGASDDDYAGTEVETLPWKGSETRLPDADAPEPSEPAEAEPAEDADQAANDLFDDVDAPASEYFDDDAAPEAETSAAPAEALDPDPEPQAGPADDPAPEEVAAGDVVDESAFFADAPPEPAPDTPRFGAAEDAAGEEAVIDENTLREMVSDIVRQELQGALGERITRNVRKLVRREIHRALTTQELD